jgi:hypothetical protein
LKVERVRKRKGKEEESVRKRKGLRRNERGEFEEEERREEVRRW